jgi:non-ribosomal peptide synthetase-like protein
MSAVILTESFTWIAAGTGLLDTYVRSIVLGGASFVYFCATPILAKWILVGRWKPHEIPVWSLAYVRFWTVKTLIRANPLVLFVGSPVYGLYLRALGARIGRGVIILSRTVPVCTDLLTIGDGTVIRKDSFFPCYRAHAGLIQIGTVMLGKDVYVGEKTVLDIDTSLGDGAQLGHTSSLQRYQAVPAGEHWHGSPAQATGVDYRRVDPARCGILRRAAFGSGQLLTAVALYLPLGASAISGLLEFLMNTPHLSVTSWTSAGRVLAASVVLYVAPILTALAVVVTVPRVLSLTLRPGRVYPLYGVRYAVQRMIARMTNLRFYNDLFGDSCYIVNYLRALGYNLHRVEQTGSNFGTELAHESPYLSSVGTGTMVSDALSIMNAEFSSTSFRVARVSIGERNFLGNNIAFPADARTGDNCLLATKVMIPLEGEIRHGVGLLGSPCFEIPRSVQSDRTFDDLHTGDELSRRLAAKKRYNTATMGVFLLVRWIRFAVVMLIAVAAAEHFASFGAWAIAAASLLLLLFGVGYSILVERLVTRFHPLTPQFCSIYQPYFWWHERVWKLLATAPFSGTPFKNLIWRLLGVRIGRRVFDDGCSIPEKTLVTIGDDCTLNAGTVIQCHSLEDGTFKSDHTVIGADCTLGVEAFVHYGVTMGRGAVLDPDSFLMKGEVVEANARWQGNPAGETRSVTSVSPAVVPAPV